VSLNIWLQHMCATPNTVYVFVGKHLLIKRATLCCIANPYHMGWLTPLPCWQRSCSVWVNYENQNRLTAPRTRGYFTGEGILFW